MKIRTFLISAAVLGLWLVPRANATTLVRMSLRQLAQASSTIVQGQVVAQTARWNPDHTRIITYTTVQLEKVLKGQPSSTLTIEQLGGTVGNFHVFVPGTAYLRPQGRYILFLEPVAGRAGAYRPVGMMQGAFRLYRGRNGRQRHVLLPLGALRTGSPSATLSQSPPAGEFQATLSGVLALPVVIPAGTSIPLVVRSTQFRGAGEAVVVARTTSDLFPGEAVVIPAGSEVVGTAQRQGAKWKIYWNSVSVRGRRAHLSATSEVPAAEGLKGKALVVQTR